jgi:PadR family transcriptional regulator, regulatory protein PadR
MSDLEFLVLTSLARQSRHGYGILQDVAAMSSGAVSPQVATLYRQLDRLSRTGLIVDDGGEVVDGRFRRYYRLTERGEQELADAVRLRAATVKVARSRLRPASTSATAPITRLRGTR